MSNEIIVIYAFFNEFEMFQEFGAKNEIICKLKSCQLQNYNVKWKIKVRGEENLILNFWKSVNQNFFQ